LENACHHVVAEAWGRNMQDCHVPPKLSITAQEQEDWSDGCLKGIRRLINNENQEPEEMRHLLKNTSK